MPRHHAGFDNQSGVLGVESHQGVEVAPGDGSVAGLDQCAKGMLAHTVLLCFRVIIQGGVSRPMPEIKNPPLS